MLRTTPAVKTTLFDLMSAMQTARQDEDEFITQTIANLIQLGCIRILDQETRLEHMAAA